MAERRATRSRARFADDARWRADNRTRERAEARQRSPPNAALYGPSAARATHIVLSGPLLTGCELVVATKERPSSAHFGPNRMGLEVWLRNNGIDPSADFVRRACLIAPDVERLVKYPIKM